MSPQERANAGDRVKIVGRWADMSVRAGVAIFESDDLAAVQRYAGQWNPYLDITLVPVHENEESAPAAALAGQRLNAVGGGPGGTPEAPSARAPLCTAA